MAGVNIKIGDLRTRVTFQFPTATRNTSGVEEIIFADVATNPTVWARWINSHGQEAVQSESLKSVQRATVTVRYRSDIVPTWQLLKDGDAWQIISVDQIQDRNRWVEMIVERAKGTI